METDDDTSGENLDEQIGEQEKRKLAALRRNKQSVWAGFGLFGMIGWSVVVPALIGAAIGIWLDKKYTQSFSWTLSLLLTGLAAGCLIAWHWVNKENKEMHKDPDNDK